MPSLRIDENTAALNEEFGIAVVASTPEAYEQFAAIEMQRWGRIVRDGSHPG